MKTKTLDIYFKGLDELHRELRRVPKTGVKRIQPKNHIYFGSIEDFRGFMTIHKLELLTVIASKKASSIYKLSRVIGRDFASVYKDCIGLESTGFIRLERNKSGRREKKPVLSFIYSCIVVHLPQAPYQIEFSEAA